MPQKFPKGSKVWIREDLPLSMSHLPFCKGVYGTVKGTYAQQFGGHNYDSYTIDIDGLGEVSWYDEAHLQWAGEPSAKAIAEEAVSAELKDLERAHRRADSKLDSAMTAEKDAGYALMMQVIIAKRLGRIEKLLESGKGSGAPL
jgi:hypothetical protein